MPNPNKLLELMYGAKDGGAVRMQDGGDPAEQMFNFNPMAAQAMRQERMRREAEEAKRYKSVMGTTPQDLLRRVEPPPAEISALPLSKTQTKLDRLARSGLEALGMPKPRAQSVTSNVKGAIEMLVPDPERIYREMSEATEERDPVKFALANLEAGLGYMPFAKPALGAAKAIGATALDAGKAAGREALRPIDQAMFGEGPLAGVLGYAAPLQAAPKMQAPVSPLGFYNPVEQAALNVQRKQGPGQAFLNELQRGENVNKDFLQSSGLAERLAAMPNVTREEVQAMAKGTVPEVQQVMLGETVVPPHAKEWLKVHMPEFDPSDVSQIDEAIALANQRYDKLVNEGELGLAEFASDAIDDLMEMKKQYKPGSKAAEALSKYGQYTIPGGKNYREMLLTIPQGPAKKQTYEEWVAGGRQGEWNSKTGIAQEPVKYQSSHWRDQPNVLSHIRMNDRIDAEGKKVLFIEELQSDWAQEGRKKGFKQSQRSYGDIQKEIDELLAKQRQVSNDALRLLNLDDGKFDAMTEEVRNLGRQVNNLLAEQKNIQEAIPSAPFVQNTKEWVDLSLKNILKRAVDEGYDRVAFINGQQSADRFRLQNVVDSIEWNPPGDRLQQKGAEGFVTIYLQNGNPVELPLTREGKVLEGIGTQFDGKGLDEIVGKEVAKEIMASPFGSLAGEGLSIGGTGMKKFYDEIVPDRVRKLVGKGNLRDIQFEDKTAKLREELANATPGSSRYLYLTDKIGQLERDAERYGALGNQLGFDITPEIREKFSKPIPYKKGGAVHISDNPDVMALELMYQPRFRGGGVSSLKGYGEGREDIEKALQAIKESAPVSAASQLASGYMSGAGGTDLEKIGQAVSMIPMIGLPATIGKAARVGKAGDVISDSLRAKYPDVDISLAGDKQLNLGKIVVPKEMRGQGVGTQVMNDLVKQADEAGSSVTLSPSADFGGNKERLKEFYKRFGFVENKGKNKDFSISESMYREPIQQKPSAFKAPQDKALLEAQRAAALPVEQGGLGLPPDNTPDMRAAAMGYQDFYHGTERLDRLLEKGALDPRRATSGPMPFGTESKQMASTYATSKRDTSRLAQDEGNVADYFTVSAKNLGYRSNQDIPVEKAFYFLPREKQQEIISKVKRIGYANPQEATGDLVLHPEGMGGSIMDPKTIDYYLQREAKGNPLTALRIMWHDSGTLYNNEEQLAKVFELAGFPFPISQKNAPWSSAQGVLTGKARLNNPLTTTDAEVIESRVIPALKQAFAKDGTRKQAYGPDQWAKNVRFTPKEWVAELEKDMAEGKNSYVWTSIPDKVTAELRKLGFDGIVDAGGKGGGAQHRVVIPFDTKQVRSRFAAFNPLKKDEPGLLKKKGGKVHISNNPDVMRLELLRKKHA